MLIDVPVFKLEKGWCELENCLIFVVSSFFVSACLARYALHLCSEVWWGQAVLGSQQSGRN